MASLQASNSITPMDVNLQKSWPETCKCYNCQNIGHLMNNCLEPCKKHAQNNFSEVDILDLVAKAINTTLNAGEQKGEAKDVMKHQYYYWMAWSSGFGVWGWYRTSPKWSEPEWSRCWLQFMHCTYLLLESRHFGHRFGVQGQDSELNERKRGQG